MSLQKLASLFLRLAQIDFSSSELSWVPKEFQELEPFKKYPLKQVIKKFEEFGLADFREEAISLSRKKTAFQLLEKIATNLWKVNELIRVEIMKILNQVDEENEESPEFLLYQKLQQSQQFIAIFNESLKQNDVFTEGKIILPENVENKVLGWKFSAGTPVIRAYLNLLSRINLLLENKVDAITNYFQIERTKEFKDFSATPKDSQIFVVFSTKINDLIGIGARGIRSCQSLFCKEEENVELDDISKNIVGTVLSRYVGVIYLTTGEDFKGRGERMIARCLVRLLYHTQEEKFYLFIDRMFPKENEEYRNLFYQALSKKSSINVIKHESEFPKLSPGFTPDEDNAPQEFVHPIGDEDIDTKYRSYMDTNFYTSVGELYDDINSEIYWKRKRAILSLPISEIEEYIYDSDQRIAIFVAERLPKEKIKSIYAAHPYWGVREKIAEKIGNEHPELFFQEKDYAVLQKLFEIITNEEKINLFIELKKDPNKTSKEFLEWLIKNLPRNFLMANLEYFDQTSIFEVFASKMEKEEIDNARTILLNLIQKGKSDMASNIFEIYIEEYQINDHELQILFNRFPNESLIKLLNSSLKRTVLDIFRYGLTAKRFGEFLESISAEEAKKVLRFDDLFEEYFPSQGWNSYPERKQKQEILKEHLHI